ncbi:ribosome biogenesis GTPase Der [Candidatus Protochlamydia phocaeensis]|uniref:ribosome biogenesis GTPase Der n=1 Tax=Candidatus Protochlamydia phocaeensis TaxID=1414722 RepID=UPI00083853CD|nr:ribosome biogenesis GTPase Der [Candidatus Protochlamydia phocaeensis]
MTHLPKLAIVGRPNVGKSALFNRICKQKIAIVDEAEGVTRDRLYAESELFGFHFQVIDTGGINSRSKVLFNEEIKRQAEIAIEEADTIIQVVDAQIGITELDKEVSKILLKTNKPVCLAVNKIDNMQQLPLMHQFHSLGISRLIPVSASQGWQIAELLEAAFENVPHETEPEPDSSSIKVAIVGRPNVGKSSLVNYLLDEERCIVSPIPGTTRDSIDISFTQDGHLYTFIDTAGIRRKKAEHEVVDKFAAIRTERAIERADLCILILDVQEGMTAQDKKIANTIEEAGKGCIILLNKWDLVKGFRMEHCLKSIEEEVPFLKHCPKIFTSAKTGRNVDKIFPLIQEVYHNSLKRITTHQLNKFIGSALQKNHPPMITGKRLRIYYMAQVDVQPPKFILFVNYPALMTETYKKYLYNQFRETYAFTGVPILMYLKGKEKREKPAARSTDPADFGQEREPEEEEGFAYTAEEHSEDYSEDSESEDYFFENEEDLSDKE